MKTFTLATPDFLEPAWFQRVRHGQHSSVVGDDGSVTVEGVSLSFRGEPPPPDTPVRVWLSATGFFICATEAELNREAQERRDREAAESAQRRQRLDDRKAEAQCFNSQIALPVSWDVGIKDVLSGLSERSWGDGRSKATVEHIYLLEDLQAARLKRRKGDFLCTAASGTNGKRWSAVVDRAHDGGGNAYPPKVTCQACLRIAQRWIGCSDPGEQSAIETAQAELPEQEQH